MNVRTSPLMSVLFGILSAAVTGMLIGGGIFFWIELDRRLTSIESRQATAISSEESQTATIQKIIGAVNELLGQRNPAVKGSPPVSSGVDKAEESSDVGAASP